MTGPGEGKIPLEGFVELASRGGFKRIVECDIYLHVKGYSLARVTHIDLEHPVFNEIVPPRKAVYTPFTVRGEIISVALRTVKYVKSVGVPVRYINVHCKTLAEALGDGAHSWVYVGGKYGGIFLGFKTEYVRKLEELAVKLGVPPRERRKEK